MIGLRSLRNRLAVVFGLIVLGAIGTIYLTVTPQLEERLRNQKLESLLADASRNVQGKPASPRRGSPGRGGRWRRAGRESGDRRKRRGADPRDARRAGGADAAGRPGLGARRRPQHRRRRSLALEAVAARRAGVAAVETGAAGATRSSPIPLIERKEVVGVAVFADTLDEVEGNVALIRRQILISGGDRARHRAAGRLPRGARAVAARRAGSSGRAQGRGGDFSNPIRADSDDELGQLAAAFDDMQQPARPARPGAQAVHRLRLARAAHADLLARRLPRAAGRRGPRRGDAARSSSSQLRGQVDRMRKLATELLDLSRLEAGALELRPEPTDLGQLAREVAAEFAPARAAARLRRRAATSPTSRSSSTATPSAWRRCCVSCSTTRCATRRRAPGSVVSAGRRERARAPRGVRRGHGIKRQNMPHIFEPFFTSNEQAQGSGLGLAIARELAERMQGG